MRQKLAGVRKNKVRKTKRSFEYTIPKPAVQELNLEDGEVPEDVEIDRDKRELTLSF